MRGPKYALPAQRARRKPVAKRVAYRDRVAATPEEKRELIADVIFAIFITLFALSLEPLTQWIMRLMGVA